MPKKFETVEERRAYYKEWYERNKHRDSVKEQQRRSTKEFRIERARFIKELKKTLFCIRCKNDDFVVLDFHHRDPNQKDIEVANMLDFSKNKILEEISKCDCLCSNCHRKVHWEEKYGTNVDE